MSFNPKVKKLAEVNSKDVNKKAIDKLGKKFNAETGKQAPFFIKLGHKFADGTEGPLFIFGKLNAFKAEIKTEIAKSPATTLRGLAFVEFDDKGKPTLVLGPVKGKLENKPVEITKAMKAAFTTAYASFKIGAPIDEKAAEALENAAEAEADEEEDDAASAPATAAAPKQDAPKQDAATAKLADVATRIEALLADFKVAKEAGDEAKAAQIDKEVLAAFAEVSSKK
jgi:hypothetical protein